MFDVEPAPEQPKRKPAQVMRKRQDQCLKHRAHPLTAALRRTIPLHPNAAPADDRAAAGLRCGTCAHRKFPWREVSKSYPKCSFGGPKWPRATAGPGTDVRAWWPACADYEAVTS